ncbi:MAG: hypothetical protein AAF682_10565 [Planctomycetota bacterium]
MRLPSFGRGAGLVLLALPVLAASCATYATPGRGADLSLFADVQVDEDLQAVFEREPAAVLPANLAVVRVQAPEYRSWSLPDDGARGAYRVVTNREIERESDLERLAALPLVENVAAFNRLLVPAEPRSDRDLREAAARLKADLLLVYTIDSSFHREGRADPIGVLTLGLFASDRIHLSSTAAALLLDTRTGFVYGAAETTAREDRWTHLLSSAASVDRQRIETEREAFAQLMDEVERLWTEILAVRALSEQGDS